MDLADQLLIAQLERPLPPLLADLDGFLEAIDVGQGGRERVERPRNAVLRALVDVFGDTKCLRPLRS